MGRDSRVFKGVPVSPGSAEGVAFVCAPAERLVAPHYRVESTARERQRLKRAVRATLRRLESLASRARARLSDTSAEILDAQQEMLRDPELLSAVDRRLERDHINAEQAFIDELSKTERKLEQSPVDLLRERAGDIRDVGRRVLRALGNRVDELTKVPRSAVVIALELFPSDTLLLDRRKVVAVVTEKGGPNSHAAILARSLGIPAISGATGILSARLDGQRVLVDGERGEIIARPSRSHRRSVLGKPPAPDETAGAEPDGGVGEEPITKDGVEIDLHANIASIRDIQEVHRFGFKGVGLFRSEYAFLESTKPPDRQRHLEIYREAARRLTGLPLVIRTLDLGGDKQPAFCGVSKGASSGDLRGLRALLENPHLLDPQLEAILETSREHDVRILFPMVLGAEELEQVIGRLDKMAGEVALRRPLLGAMIETPAAIFALDDILDLVDFISIGTNDLTQFVLAGDRNAVPPADHLDILHPGMLRALGRIAETALLRGREVSLCGEAAGEPRLLPVFVGLGLRSLSMTPVRFRPIRDAVRAIDTESARALVGDLLRVSRTDQARRILRDYYRSHLARNPVEES